MIEPKPEWAEHGYLIEERLGIMCGLGEPTDRQRQIAKIEADKWLEQQRKPKTCSKNSNPPPPSTGASSATPSVSAATVASGLNTPNTADLFAVNATRKQKPYK